MSISLTYEIENLKCYYGKKIALDIKSLKIGEGIIGLWGPNGSGKSTLLRALAFLQPFDGVIKFFGKTNPTIEEQRSAALLLQNPALLKRSVFENVAYGLYIRKVPRNEITSRVEAALASVGLEFSFARRAWYALSGGEAQRVALAARLVLNPKVLLLDEPTASVDISGGAAITEVLRKEAEKGRTIIISSHDKEWLASLASEMAKLPPSASPPS